jgi:hypothetical protein
VLLVDMPGYGHAVAKQSSAQQWAAAARRYFRERRSLQAVFVLVDCGRGLSALDRALITELEALGRPYQVVLTKADLLLPKQLARAHRLVADEILEDRGPDGAAPDGAALEEKGPDTETSDGEALDGEGSDDGPSLQTPGRRRELALHDTVEGPGGATVKVLPMVSSRHRHGIEAFWRTTLRIAWSPPRGTAPNAGMRERDRLGGSSSGRAGSAARPTAPRSGGRGRGRRRRGR